jgi:hypothetical protein
MQFKPIPANMAIDLYTGLINARRLKLPSALSLAVKAVGVKDIDKDLGRLVPLSALDHVASLGLRGERVFPAPTIIKQSPPLIGYYRMLLGLSQKEFGQPQRLVYGPWVRAEQTGRLTENLVSHLDKFCSVLITPLVELVQAMDQFDDRDLNDLALLTLGSTLQGGRNNVIGSKAAKDVFGALRSHFASMITYDSPRLIRFQTRNDRIFELVAGSDPDIAINEGTGSNTSPLLAIEVKGGKDVSNVHNRAGEAEKSHLKAKLQGYTERWTVIHMTGVDSQTLQSESPSSTRLFEAADILIKSGSSWTKFKQEFDSLTS